MYSEWDTGAAWLVNMADTSGAAVKTSGYFVFRQFRCSATVLPAHSTGSVRVT
jgi:hypothetical protein